MLRTGYASVGQGSIARAQSGAPTRVYRVGFVTSIGKAYLYPLEDPRSGIVRTFAEGLRDLGYEDGKNLALMQRGRRCARSTCRYCDRTHSLRRGNNRRYYYGTVPIVMAASFDPVAAGVVRDLSKPAGNITGFSNHPGARV